MPPASLFDVTVQLGEEREWDVLSGKDHAEPFEATGLQARSASLSWPRRMDDFADNPIVLTVDDNGLHHFKALETSCSSVLLPTEDPTPCLKCWTSVKRDQQPGRLSTEWPHLVCRKMSRMTLYGMCWIPFIVRRESALMVEGLFSVKIMCGTLLAYQHNVN